LIVLFVVSDIFRGLHKLDGRRGLLAKKSKQC
jgi:hypothetical protein